MAMGLQRSSSPLYHAARSTVAVVIPIDVIATPATTPVVTKRCHGAVANWARKNAAE
jgi:hypothetical protein